MTNTILRIINKMDRFCIFLLHLGLVKTNQHILLDSTKESMLDWFKYPKGPQSPTPGWAEDSFTNFDKGINWRSYVVCDVGYPNVNNWLWTPFIERGNANRIYIEIKYSIRNCELFPGTALQCKESFSLLFYEFDAATHQPPPWEPEAYKLIDKIEADEGRFTNNNEVIINTVTRYVEVDKKGIYFAFRDQGACLSLLAVKVYAESCPMVIAAFAIYHETPTGTTESAMDKVDGVCVANSIPMDNKPFSFCNNDGTWLHTQGHGCQCMAGYKMDRSKRESCISCPIGKYKALPGNGECDSCPFRSNAPFAGSVECQCNNGYYRAISDPKADACTRPPSRIRNLTLTKFDTTSVTLKWEVPRDIGGRNDTMYRILYKDCTANRTANMPLRDCTAKMQFNPHTETFLPTFIVIENLLPNTTYRFVVYSKNGVSDMTRERPQFADMFVTTAPANTIDHVHGVPSTQYSIRVNTMASQGEIAAVEVYTTNEPVMAKQIEYKGMLMSSKVKSTVGGEMKGLSKLMADIREELLWELREKAVQAGSNAIVGLRMETNSIFRGVLEMVVYGTAVYFQR